MTPDELLADYHAWRVRLYHLLRTAVDTFSDRSLQQLKEDLSTTLARIEAEQLRRADARVTHVQS